MEDFTLFLNWIRIWRSYTPEGYDKSKAIVDDLKTRYSEGNPVLDVMDSWQISQKIQLKLSQNEEEDRDRLRFILNRLTSENPDLSDGFNAKALITLTRLGGSCEDAIADISHAEKLGGGQETLMMGAVVYNRCGESKKAILETYTKEYSAEYQSQALIDLAKKLKTKIPKLNQIKKIDIFTSHHTHYVIGTGANDPQKMDPNASRETLDHSIICLLYTSPSPRD